MNVCQVIYPIFSMSGQSSLLLLKMHLYPFELIFLTYFNHFLISGDFGLSVTVNDLNKTDIIEGDSKYLAPELLDKRCDEKADIFR